MREAISGLLEKTGLSAAEVAKLVVYAPDSRLGQRLAGRLGFDVERQLASTFFNRTGDTGVPQVLLSLIDVLSSAKPEEKIIVAGYGDGAEAILLRTTERIQRAQGVPGSPSPDETRPLSHALRQIPALSRRPGGEFL